MNIGTECNSLDGKVSDKKSSVPDLHIIEMRKEDWDLNVALFLNFYHEIEKYITEI